MVSAGKLDRRFQFQQRREQSDGMGNTVSDWVSQFTLAAGRSFLRGGETVIAARLENKQPAIVTIRNSTDARQITADWRAIDVRDGRVYNIRETPKESDDRGFLEFLAESGVAG